jgi:hypothetical protein
MATEYHHDGFDMSGAVVSERKMRTEDRRGPTTGSSTSRLRSPPTRRPDRLAGGLDATTFATRCVLHKFYSPGRAVISLVGDFTVREALKTVDRHYG